MHLKSEHEKFAFSMIKEGDSYFILVLPSSNPYFHLVVYSGSINIFYVFLISTKQHMCNFHLLSLLFWPSQDAKLLKWSKTLKNLDAV